MTDYTFKDPAAPTLEEATSALLMANTWRRKYEEADASARLQYQRAELLEAKLAECRGASA